MKRSICGSRMHGRMRRGSGPPHPNAAEERSRALGCRAERPGCGSALAGLRVRPSVVERDDVRSGLRADELRSRRVDLSENGLGGAVLRSRGCRDAPRAIDDTTDRRSGRSFWPALGHRGLRHRLGADDRAACVAVVTWRVGGTSSLLVQRWHGDRGFAASAGVHGSAQHHCARG
jgi:hypothetical protein